MCLVSRVEQLTSHCPAAWAASSLSALTLLRHVTPVSDSAATHSLTLTHTGKGQASRPKITECSPFPPRDTAGQERFNSITSAYYRGAKGIVLVYDITKQETFDDLPKWMKMIDKYASEEAELLLVGNKLDCETDRIITRQQAERFASRISGMRFCESSAKDNFNVDEIFLKLVDDILSKMPLEMTNNELSNSILSLQPEPEVPPELTPPRMRCC
ncbi:ras-related protein Rab-12 isoform X2 [Osmerus mordax]|uniref:ras-related protein Rab-12 isoform X2 n=1 Tax=Osmerus mordax TaxID=8014 RepID=UPI00350E95C9